MNKQFHRRNTGKIKFHIRCGDTVEVISGNYRGAQGRILQIVKDKSRAIVEGVGFITKHQRRTQDQPNGALIKREGSIHISNLKLIAKGSNKPEA